MIQIKSPKRGKQIAADENRGHRGNWISPFGVMMHAQSEALRRRNSILVRSDRSGLTPLKIHLLKGPLSRVVGVRRCSSVFRLRVNDLFETGAHLL